MVVFDNALYCDSIIAHFIVIKMYNNAVFLNTSATRKEKRKHLEAWFQYSVWLADY